MCVKIRKNSRICLGEHFIIFFFSGNTRGTARGLARAYVKENAAQQIRLCCRIVFGLEAP